MASRDESAQRWFYERVWPHAAVLLRTARIMTGNDAEADDVVQETMLKAFKAIETFREGTDAKAWLMAILRNSRIDRLRAGAASAQNVSLEEIDELADATTHDLDQDFSWQNPEEILNAFSDQQIIETLQQLPEAIRWTLLLTDVEGLDHQEAAGILEVPLGTVKSRVHRGRAMLREALLPLARDLRLIPQKPSAVREETP